MIVAAFATYDANACERSSGDALRVVWVRYASRVSAALRVLRYALVWLYYNALPN